MNGWINFAEFTFPMKVSGWIWSIALIIFLYSVLSDLILILLQQQRTVYRLTLVKAWNVEELQAYSELVSLGKPDFIEVKVSCWLLGDSPNRECHPCGTVYLQKWMLPVVFNRWWMRDFVQHEIVGNAQFVRPAQGGFELLLFLLWLTHRHLTVTLRLECKVLQVWRVLPFKEIKNPFYHRCIHPTHSNTKICSFYLHNLWGRKSWEIITGLMVTFWASVGIWTRDSPLFNTNHSGTTIESFSVPTGFSWLCFLLGVLSLTGFLWGVFSLKKVSVINSLCIAFLGVVIFFLYVALKP